MRELQQRARKVFAGSDPNRVPAPIQRAPDQKRGLSDQSENRFGPFTARLTDHHDEVRRNPKEGHGGSWDMAAVVVLRDAINAADQLGRAPDPIWSEIAEQMCLPRRGPAVVSHDDYRRDEEKGGTPDPLMGIFPFGYPLSPEHETATLNFYLGQAESYIGSPMLSALYGAWAARLGDRRQAARRLDQGYGGFVQGRFLQTLEYRTDRFPEQPRAGPFFANIGGFLTGLLFGFTGLRPSPGKPSDWIERDSCLPSGWRGIEVERLWLGGEPVSLSARQGRRPTLTPLAGLSQKA